MSWKKVWVATAAVSTLLVTSANAQEAKRSLVSDFIRYERTDGPDSFRHIEVDFHPDGTVHVRERVQEYSTHEYSETLPAAELAKLVSVEKGLDGLGEPGPERSSIRLWQQARKDASRDDGLPGLSARCGCDPGRVDRTFRGELADLNAKGGDAAAAKARAAVLVFDEVARAVEKRKHEKQPVGFDYYLQFSRSKTGDERNLERNDLLLYPDGGLELVLKVASDPDRRWTVKRTLDGEYLKKVQALVHEAGIDSPNPNLSVIDGEDYAATHMQNGSTRDVPRKDPWLGMKEGKARKALEALLGEIVDEVRRMAVPGIEARVAAEKAEKATAPAPTKGIANKLSGER